MTAFLIISYWNIVLEGLTDGYDQIKYNAEADDKLTLDKVIYTMRDLHAII